MHTISYILQHGLESLKTELGITVKEQGDLILLSYDQINSPKTHPVVKECRGLILEKDTYNIVFRCMERFFNYTEADTDKLDYSNAMYYDKVDGSLIKIYSYKGVWYIATRGTITADIPTSFNITFEDLVLKALNLTKDEFQVRAQQTLNEHLSYNFEVTSLENRVVTKYEGYTLTYLNARHTLTGIYVDASCDAVNLGAVENVPLLSKVSIDEVLDFVDNIPDLREGLVAYIDNIPVCKFKNKLYVDIHHSSDGLTNEKGLSSKRVIKMVFDNEQDEYLSYFPEKLFLFEPYIKARGLFLDTLAFMWRKYKDIDNIKDFAIATKSNKLRGILINKYKNPDQSFESLLNLLTTPSQIEYMEYFKKILDDI